MNFPSQLLCMAVFATVSLTSTTYGEDKPGSPDKSTQVEHDTRRQLLGDFEKQSGKTGAYKISTTGFPAKLYIDVLKKLDQLDKVKLGSLEKQKALVESTPVVNFAGENAKISYKVYAPKAVADGMPAGVLVYISPGETGGLPASFHEVLDEHRLIMISPNGAGNSVPTQLRQILSVHSVALLKARYKIDESRIYTSGFSGGGRVASLGTFMHSDLFSGSLHICGGSTYVEIPFGEIGTIKPIFARPSEDTIKAVKTNFNIVLLTGSADMNRPEAQAIKKLYDEQGYKHVFYIEQAGMAHELPDAETFSRAVKSLTEKH